MASATITPFEVTTQNATFNVTTAAGTGRRTTSRTTLNIVLTVTIAFVMFGIGCGIDISKLKSYLKKPTGVIIGAMCQFVIMPTIAFALAKVFQMGDVQTVALLLIGSAPGGTTSNTVAYWIDGDIDLSVTMTTVSSFLGFGMMPLLLWIYQFGFSFPLRVPFDTIGITLAGLLAPITVGIVTRYKFPRQAPIILKVLAIVGIIALIAVLVMSIITYNGLYTITTGQTIYAAIFPGIGMTLGYGLSSLASLYNPLYLSRKQRKTISLETGIQNTQLTSTIINLSGFTLEEVGPMILFPTIYFVSQCVWVGIGIIGYRIYLCRKPPSDRIEDEESEDGKQKSISIKKENFHTNTAQEEDKSIPFSTNCHGTAVISVTKM